MSSELIEEDTTYRNDLSAESAFKAMHRTIDDDATCVRIGGGGKYAWVLRIANAEQNIPILVTQENGMYFSTIDPSEWDPSLSELKKYDISETIPPGEYIVFSPELDFEREDWFTFTTKQPMVVRRLHKDGWLGGMYISEN